ncbi:uncharacterized protein KY384_004285 [Bacidia gigantensis]|uniref:uncharacterized protein n=1 Tax=Bacidia gigantensis TaxID=2732470 RepID=UPI001D0449DC|nr:uncharacterized protein KY384_004285 [Bacidia gigantensis]KAG8530928.1 hypothetical protein KY384_004285 [Bacidia gigantensis]
MEQPSATNRRQPVRQTRTNNTRTSAQAVFSATSGAQPHAGTNQEAPGFYPAITHFTDAITALPKEMIRHYTMLKEVEAKICGPEERMLQLLSAGLKAPALKQTGPSGDIEPLPDPNNPESQNPRFARRNFFLEMRRELVNSLGILDEKNHVMNTATDCLDKQIKRCQSSYPHIEEEISEEARLGSMTHWAYNTEKPTEKKGMIGGERTRRAANHLAVETEAAAMRSEVRREAVAARKGKHPIVDSDFDDSRTVGRKAQNGGKGKKGGILSTA